MTTPLPRDDGLGMTRFPQRSFMLAPKERPRCRYLDTYHHGPGCRHAPSEDYATVGPSHPNTLPHSLHSNWWPHYEAHALMAPHSHLPGGLRRTDESPLWCDCHEAFGIEPVEADIFHAESLNPDFALCGSYAAGGTWFAIPGRPEMVTCPACLVLMQQEETP